MPRGGVREATQLPFEKGCTRTCCRPRSFRAHAHSHAAYTWHAYAHAHCLVFTVAIGS